MQQTKIPFHRTSCVVIMHSWQTSTRYNNLLFHGFFNSTYHVSNNRRVKVDWLPEHFTQKDAVFPVMLLVIVGSMVLIRFQFVHGMNKQSLDDIHSILGFAQHQFHSFRKVICPGSFGSIPKLTLFSHDVIWRISADLSFITFLFL